MQGVKGGGRGPGLVEGGGAAVEVGDMGVVVAAAVVDGATVVVGAAVV